MTRLPYHNNVGADLEKELVSMKKKSALWVAALTAGAAVLVARYVLRHKEELQCQADSVEHWIENADQHLQKLQLKLTTNDGQVA